MADLATPGTLNYPASMDFGIRLEFEPGRGEPSRIFRTMTGLIEAAESIDRDLAASISIRVFPALVLQDIQAGSLTAWLRYLLESIDDEALKNLDWKKAVGAYLVKGKKKLIEFLDERETVRNAREIYQLRGAIQESAAEAGLTLISLNSPVPAPRVAENLRLVSEATIPLLPGDTALFLSPEGAVPINTAFRLTPEAIESILTIDSATNETEMILMVKKPDFLGNSMWDFRHDGKRIPAKVTDTRWLESFHRGAVALRSGDALRAWVEIQTNYGTDREIVGVHYRIVEVLEVIPREG
jgi:hypothetical protein